MLSEPLTSGSSAGSGGGSSIAMATLGKAEAAPAAGVPGSTGVGTSAGLSPSAAAGEPAPASPVARTSTAFKRTSQGPDPSIRPSATLGQDDPKRRKIGFEQPLHPRQLMALFGFLFCVATYSALQAAFLPAVVSVIYYFIFACGLYCYVKISTTDPYLDRKHVSYPDKIEHPDGKLKDQIVYCNTCFAYMPVRTKHCRLCKKCVEGFDHHCLYLNTCIAAKNYRPFLGLAFLGTVLPGYQLAAAVVQWISFATGKQIPGGLDQPEVVIWILVPCNLFVVAVFGGVASLLAFHTFLVSKGLTTYEWIIAERTRELKKKEEKEQKEKKKREEEELRLQKEAFSNRRRTNSNPRSKDSTQVSRADSAGPKKKMLDLGSRPQSVASGSEFKEEDDGPGIAKLTDITGLGGKKGDSDAPASPSTDSEAPALKVETLSPPVSGHGEMEHEQSLARTVSEILGVADVEEIEKEADAEVLRISEAAAHSHPV